MDARTKIILSSVTTSAQVHDSQVFQKLVKLGDKEVYADSGYVGPTTQEHAKKCGVKTWICERGARARELTINQKNNNQIISKTRSRVEHVFGQVKGAMKGFYQRCIGIERNKGNIELTNLVYNFLRFEQIIRLKLAR